MESVSLKGLLTWAVLAAGLVVMVKGDNFDCENYDSKVCTLDAIPFCLTNGTIVTGRCEVQRAVCQEKKAVDKTFAACAHQYNTGFNCEAYLTHHTCTRDLIPFCLNNGTVVRGTCAAKEAVCREKKAVVDDFSVCNKAAVPNSGDDDGNAAVALTATTSLLHLGLLFLLSTLLF